ncbi:hypothetical protein DFH94DRAFT_689310 [Russula ochroleuca]|uniref:Uncharacterized protein n=1 Tax=Russula ochroleuca TaxID=152965 RepID=A0A9P5N2L2_9AGAM|nr:hypothetical protein DFH94DRAFT_689310 [Russula ochroleuca]
MASTDTKLLDILEAHGQTFLDSFKPHKAEKNKRKRAAGDTTEAHRSTKLVRAETDQSSSVGDYSDSAEEWTGFGSDAQVDDEYEIQSSAEEAVSLEASTSIHKPDVVVFSGYGSKTLEPLSKKMQGKAFMSSNVSKLRDATQEERKTRTAESIDDEDDELTNAQNDALLHRLVHTQLLSGSLNRELGLTSAQRKKAMEGRILELSGSSKLGQGEKVVRAQERDKASKRVREGLLDKQKQRREKQVQEAKDMGNYHPTFKKLFQDPLEKNTKRNRERGLRMGVGSFGGGMLRLSKREIETVQSRPTSSRLRGRPHKKK